MNKYKSVKSNDAAYKLHSYLARYYFHMVYYCIYNKQIKIFAWTDIENIKKHKYATVTYSAYSYNS